MDPTPRRLNRDSVQPFASPASVEIAQFSKSPDPPVGSQPQGPGSRVICAKLQAWILAMPRPRASAEGSLVKHGWADPWAWLGGLGHPGALASSTPRTNLQREPHRLPVWGSKWIIAQELCRGDAPATVCRSAFPLGLAWQGFASRPSKHELMFFLGPFFLASLGQRETKLEIRFLLASEIEFRANNYLKVPLPR